MPASSPATEKTASKPGRQPRAKARSVREADARREIAELSERIDRGLALLEEDRSPDGEGAAVGAFVAGETASWRLKLTFWPAKRRLGA
jgi:hypothetical protein